MSQPNVEEVRQVGVANIVIVRWVGGKGEGAVQDGSSVLLLHRAAIAGLKIGDGVRDPRETGTQGSGTRREWVAFGVVPNHRNCLACKNPANLFLRRT